MASYQFCYLNTTTDQDVVATYNAKTGALINLNFLAYPVGANYLPAGMALSGNNLSVANYGELDRPGQHYDRNRQPGLHPIRRSESLG